MYARRRSRSDGSGSASGSVSPSESSSFTHVVGWPSHWPMRRTESKHVNSSQRELRMFGFARHYLVGTIRYYHKYDSLQNRLSQNRAKFSFFGENKITRHPMIAVGLAEVGTPDANLWHDPCQWWHRVLHNLWPQELFREWSGWCDGSGNIIRSFCVTRSMEEVPSGGYRSCRRLRKWNANHNFSIYAS